MIPTRILMVCSFSLMFFSNTYAQVGIGTTNPDNSAQLDVVSTSKGFLPPRMTTTERNSISNAATGLVIYNTEQKCLEILRSQKWENLCAPNETPTGADFNDGFEENDFCTSEEISVTSCSFVTGASLNDDVATTEGTEYDWSEADSYMSGGSTRALIEINGQCWFARNTNKEPSNPIADTPTNGSNIWGQQGVDDEGYWGYYNMNSNNSWGTTEPANGEGLKYQWSAAMNSETENRSQGVCPNGWHVPSDCEWSYLENNLGMGTFQQKQGTEWREEGSVGLKLSNLTDNGNGTNISGFNGLLSGFRFQNGIYTRDGVETRGRESWFWSSTTNPTTNKYWARRIDISQTGVYRYDYAGNRAMSVRCIKD